MRIEDMIVVSDLDGTVIPGTGIISKENIAAVRRFREKGGIFTCASGRSPVAAQDYADLLDIQGPIICNNGAVIFDRKTGKAIWSKMLPSHYREIVRAIHERNSPPYIEAVTEDNEYYIVTVSEERRRFLEEHPVAVYHYVGEDGLPESCIKVAFVLEEDSMEATIADILSQGYQGVEFVKSGGHFFEMMAGGITKGYPLEILAGAYGKTLDNVIAIGDFYNDMDMLKKAHFGATLENAPDAVKAVADRVFPSCGENGAAAFLEFLIQHHKEI